MPEKYFDLMKGERVISEITPLRPLKHYLFARWLIITAPFLLAIAWFTSEIEIMAGAGIENIVPVYAMAGILYIVALWVLMGNKYRQQKYWLTNRRAIYKHGFFGYEVNSMPLESIADVIVSRTTLERLFGFGSVHIQTEAGQGSWARYGAEGSFLAVPNPEKLQSRIFELSGPMKGGKTKR